MVSTSLIIAFACSREIGPRSSCRRFYEICLSQCEAEFLSDGRVLVMTRLMGRYTVQVCHVLCLVSYTGLYRETSHHSGRTTCVGKAELLELLLDLLMLIR